MKKKIITIAILLTIAIYMISAQSVKLKTKQLEIGDTRTTHNKLFMELNMAVSIGDQEIQEFSMNNSENKVSTAVIKKVEVDKIAELSVEYQEYLINNNKNGESTDSIAPVSGKKYIILYDEDIIVTYEDGTKPPQDEIDLVLNDYEEQNDNE
ncbi:MAG: hypothetical protein MJB14_10070, partial [Spirochaetes bacterium]|nr:hypothetical protein [Spirochaetota bacterium]